MIKYKILFVSHSSALRGGGEDEFERLLKHYYGKDSEYEIHCLFPKGEKVSKLKKYCVKWDIYHWGYFPVIYNNFFEYIKYFAKIIIQIFQVFRFIYKKEYDLCVVNSVVLIWPVLAVRFMKIPTFVFVREDIYPVFARHLIYKIYNYLNCFFIPNSKTKMFDIINRTNTRNIDFVYPAIEVENIIDKCDDLSFLSPVVIDKLKNRNVFKIINVGSINNKKNQFLILESLYILRQRKNVNVPYVFFIGDSNDKSEYVKKINKYLNDNNLKEYCFFIGELEKDQLFKLYRHVKVNIIASKSEGMPINMIESFLYKIPVISTKTGGIPEILINMENGILIDFNKYDLAEAIELLTHDEVLYNKLITNAHETFVKNFGFKNAMSKTENLLLSNIAK